MRRAGVRARRALPAAVPRARAAHVTMTLVCAGAAYDIQAHDTSHNHRIPLLKKVPLVGLWVVKVVRGHTILIY